MGALAAIGVIVSMFLPWRGGGIYPSDIPVEFLWNRDAVGNPSLLVLLIPLAVVLVIGAFVPMGAGLRLFGAIGTLMVVGVFAYQLHRVSGHLGDALDTGYYVAAIGGVLAFMSGLLPSGWRSRREVVRSDVA